MAPHSLRMRGLIQIVVLGLLLYLIVAGFTGLSDSVEAVRTARPSLVLLAAICVGMSYVCAALTYRLLAARRLVFRQLLLLQISGGLVNRLLPAGLGGLGVNAYYLKRHGHTLTQATAIVTLNNLLGFIGNVLLVAGIVMFAPPHVSIRVHISSQQLGLILAGLLVVSLALRIIARRYGRKMRLYKIKSQLQAYFHLLVRRPVATGGALVSSLALTSLHVSGLYLVLQALSVHGSWAAALLAISGGTIVAALVPTPGGLGGAEAGIAGMLVACGIPLAMATTAAILYRGLTYWLPLLPGYVALRIVEKRYL